VPFLKHDCGSVMEVELTNNGVTSVLFGFCCGWGQMFSPSERVFDSLEEAVNDEGTL
jgi:hypothetical protein